jgi:hypothetical protein
MNIGNSTQIFIYIFSTTKEDKIRSYVNIFKNIKNIDFTDIQPLFLIIIVCNLKKNLNETYEEFKQFCNRENIKNVSRYNRCFNDALMYLHQVKINYKNIYFNLNNIDITLLNEVEDYDEKLFLNLHNVTVQLIKNSNIKKNVDIDNLLLLLELKNTVEKINLYSDTKINKTYFNSRYEHILSLDKQNILNKIANITSLEYHSKILYNENNKKANETNSILHLDYYNQLKEILNLLG